MTYNKPEPIKNATGESNCRYRGFRMCALFVENASQLCSYVGITPTIRESGSSIRGRSRISKVGNKKLRNLLFLCSFNACKQNRACRAIYERIVNKGKSKKLALIAVANKLLRQAFAIAKSGIPYDETFVSVLRK